MKPTNTERAEAGAIRSGSIPKPFNYLVSNQRDFVFDTAIKVLQKQLYLKTATTAYPSKAQLFFASSKTSIYQIVCKENRHYTKGSSKFTRLNFNGNRGEVEAL